MLPALAEVRRGLIVGLTDALDILGADALDAERERDLAGGPAHAARRRDAQAAEREA